MFYYTCTKCTHADLLDGSSDSVDYDSALVAAADVNVSTSSNGTSRYVVFSGPASDYQYTEVGTPPHIVQHC